MSKDDRVGRGSCVFFNGTTLADEVEITRSYAHQLTHHSSGACIHSPSSTRPTDGQNLFLFNAGTGHTAF